MNETEIKPKSLDELYSDYKLFYAKRFIEIANTKKELFDVLREISLSDLSKREDLFNAFKKKCSELGIKKDEFVLDFL